LIEKGEISEMKEAMEKALTPGSQTFEQSLFKMNQGRPHQPGRGACQRRLREQSALAHEQYRGGRGCRGGKDRVPQAKSAASTGSAPFSEFKLDVDETERA